MIVASALMGRRIYTTGKGILAFLADSYVRQRLVVANCLRPEVCSRYPLNGS